MNVALGESKSVYSQLDRSYTRAIEPYEQGLKAVINLMIVSGQKNIQGHTDEHRNVLVLLRYHADGDEQQ